MKDAGIKFEDQVDELQRTFKEINDDDKSDKSIIKEDDSEADYELIEDYKNTLEDQIAVYSVQIPPLYEHLQKVVDINIQLTRELEEM